MTREPIGHPAGDHAAIDLGSGHTLRFTSWAPDRELNPQYDDLPDVERIGAIESHQRPDGSICEGILMFDSEVTRRLFSGRPVWTVESWDPLTLSPSIQCGCGEHGFIRNGRWVDA